MLYWFGFCLLHDERHGQKRKSYAPFVSGALFYLFVPGIPAAPAPIDRTAFTNQITAKR